jgi:hypothetical protein
MRHTLASLSLVGLMVAGIAGGLRAQTSPAKPTIVLVHGAKRALATQTGPAILVGHPYGADGSIAKYDQAVAQARNAGTSRSMPPPTRSSSARGEG